jgi:hypothetical protein
MTRSKNILLQTTTKMILPLLKKEVLVCGVILGFLSFGFRSNGHKTLINDQ